MRGKRQGFRASREGGDEVGEAFRRDPRIGDCNRLALGFNREYAQRMAREEPREETVARADIKNR